MRPRSSRSSRRCFRAAHSLKGAARAVNFTEIESVCQSLERPVRRLEARRERADARARSIRRTSRARSRCRTSIAAAGDRAAAAAGRRRTRRSSAEPSRRPQPRTSAAPADTDTVRIAVSTLDARLLEAEEMLAAKLAASQRAADLGALAGQFRAVAQGMGARCSRRRALRRRSSAETAMPDHGGLLEFFDWNQDYAARARKQRRRPCGAPRSRTVSWSASWSTICSRIPRSC